jgi:GT2 family glycosyltransferase
MISILLPARDAEHTLEPCLRSIHRQSEPRWECVVVDDGSRDGTAALVDSFAGRDPRFRVLRTEHRGIVGALQAGLEQCRGRYVARMDADDVMHRRRLEMQFEALERDSGLAGVGCHVRCFPRDELGEGMRSYEDWLNSIGSEDDLRREAFVECPVAHPALMIRRDVLLELGYRDAGWAEDYDLLLRLLERGERLSAVPRRLLSWRIARGSLSRNDPAYKHQRFVECKAAFLARGFLASSSEYILWGYGSTGRSLARALRAHDKRPSWIVEIHPGRIGNRIQDVEVIPPERLPDVRRAPIVASVAGLEPRTKIREALRAMGFRELEDFVCAA